MNQSFFKEILEQEIHSVFLNPAEFGESVTLEGRTLDAVVDRPEMAWPEADDRPGVSNEFVVLAVALSDFPDELWPGKPVNFNGERWNGIPPTARRCVPSGCTGSGHDQD